MRKSVKKKVQQRETVRSAGNTEEQAVSVLNHIKIKNSFFRTVSYFPAQPLEPVHCVSHD